MRSHCLAFAWLGLAAGCSSTTETSAPPPVIGPQEEAGAPAPTGTLELLITEANDADVAISRKPVPLPNANVSFYPAGGERKDAVSGADGVARFTGIDWALGRGSLVVYAPDHTITIGTDVAPDTLAAAERFWDYPGFVASTRRHPSKATELTTVTGRLLNKKAPGNSTAVGATVPGSQFLDLGATFTIAVAAKNQPFTLFAVDVSQTPGSKPVYTYEKWVKVDAPAGATNVDIDFATAAALTSTKISRTFTIPGGAAGPLGGATAYVSLVDELANGVPLGFVVSQTPAADGSSVAVTAEYVTGTPLMITQNVLATADNSLSFLTEAGVPADGKTLSDFMLPPVVSVTQAKLKAPIVVEGVEVGSRPGISATAENGDPVLELFSLVPAAAASVTMTFPVLPAAALSQLGSAPMTAVVLNARSNDRVEGSKLGIPVHVAVSRSFTLNR